MFTFLLVVQAIVAALLVTVILMQKSEGGGLGVGGSPAGLMSARGAADFLTRSTTVLASIFVLIRIISIPDTFFGTADRGIGIWISLLSALALILAGLVRATEEL